MEEKKVTAKMVQKVFGGGRIAVENKPLFCKHCDRELIPEYERLWNAHAPVKELVAVLEKRQGRIVKRIWPNGKQNWGCAFCGREVESGNGKRK